MTACDTVEWDVPMENQEWVGPITVTATASGMPVSPLKIQFAVVPSQLRPQDADWSAPVANPDGTTDIGVQVVPVTIKSRFGIWAKITDSPNLIVIKPDDVGYVNRT